MPKYQITVMETRTYERNYMVEADTAEEAIVNASNGETISETGDDTNFEVGHREPRERAEDLVPLDDADEDEDVSNIVDEFSNEDAINAADEREDEDE